MKRQYVKYWDGGIYWLFNGYYHRDRDLPDEYNFENGKLISVIYYQHGKLHRITGPAVIFYKSKIKRYYYQDREYSSFGEMLMMEACR